MMFNGSWETREFFFPAVCQNFEWRLFVDTAAATPNDIYPLNSVSIAAGPKPCLHAALKFEAHSMRVYLAVADKPIAR
jgi:glycogen operon protein